MADGDGVAAVASHGDLGLLLVGIARLLGEREVGIVEPAGHEQVHIDRLGTVVGIDEVSVLAMVFHACAHTAPHALVHLRVDAIALWSQGGEIDIAPGRGVLGGKDVVEHGVLVEVGITRVVSLVAEHLGELQHVVGVAAFGSVGIVDIPVAVAHREEMLVHAVASDTGGAVVGHVAPEVVGRESISRCGGVVLGHTLKADILGHLGVGVPVVQEGGVERLHAVDHRLMTVLARGVEIFFIAEERVGIGHTLVHSAMLGVEHVLHGAVGELAHHVHAPVGQFAKQFFGHPAAGIEIGVSQAGQHLVLTVERHPPAHFVELGEVAGIQTRPRAVDGLAPDEAVETVRIVVIGILTILQNTEHIVETLLEAGLGAGIMARGVCQGEGREIMTSDMPGEVETAATPVLKVGMLRQPAGIDPATEAGLTDKRGEQTVDIILHEMPDVEIHRRLERTVQERYLTEIEMMGIELALGLDRMAAKTGHGGRQQE